MIKSYRGLLADGEQVKINLGTPNGKTGYRIVKLEIMSQEPGGGANSEHLVEVWSEEQTTIDGNVNFSKVTLLGAAIANNATTGYTYPSVATVVFDNVIFNQDIFVTHHDGQSTQGCNYHIELEQIKLSELEALVSIVQNLRTEQ